MKKVFNFGIIVIISLVFVFMTSLQAFAADVPVLDGQVTISDSVGNGIFSDGTYTATAKGGLLSKKTNTITITNETETGGKISFDYSVAKASSFTIDGVSGSASDSYTAMLDAGGTVVIKITSNSGFSNLTVTLTLTNINFELATGSEITFEFDKTLGTVTADGSNINSGDKKEVPAGETIEMIATPVMGATFIGWIDAETNEIISLDAAYTYKPSDDKTIRALFSVDTPYFMVDEKYIYDDLNKAVQMGSTVVLLCNGTLTAGNYTIPEGKTLLIPFNKENDSYTTQPVAVNESVTATSCFPYRTLTLETGAHIIVDGALSVPAKQSYKQGTNGSPVGVYGHIAMQEGSFITVNNGGNLYAWGYITGLGSVTAKSGATVYEDFQSTDWRGGTATTSMIEDIEKVFPMSQYYVQNIEVPLTMEAGAIENGYISLNVPLLGSAGTAVPFIGSDGMFNIESGSITKDYDEAKDRLVIDVNGTLCMESIELSLAMVGTIDSSQYVLPINGNITLNVEDGSDVNVTQDIALLPGGEINVCKGATCTFSENTKAFIYDSDEWGGYTSKDNNLFLPVKYAALGKKYDRTKDEPVDAKIYIEGVVDASASNTFVYTTASGADVQGYDGGLVRLRQGTDTITYQATQGGSEGKEIFYSEIPVTTALLKNADGTYTDPKDFVDCLSYTYSNGEWNLHNFSKEWTIDEEPTCTTEGSKSRHCLDCSNGKTDITVIDALGHDPITHEAQAPTCETIGWKAYETCSRCDYTTYSEIASLGHDTINHEAQAPTCDAIGWDAYETCSRCNYTTYEEIASLGHSYGEKWIEADETYHKKVCANDENHVKKEEHTFDNFICTVCGYSVPSIGKTSGWESIKETISATSEEKVTVEMNGVEEVPAGVFETIAGTDTTVEFKINDEISWTIKGDEVTEAVDFSEINLNVELSTDMSGIPEAEVKKVEAEEKHKLELAHNGEFGFTMYLNIEFGAEKAGKWANLYYFNTDTQLLEFQESVIIDKNGVAEFSFSHASSYVATISEETATLKETATNTTYSIVDEKITINTALNFEVSADAQIMIATYTENGNLLDISVKTPSTLEAVTFSSKDVAKIKVFVWNGLETMRPVSLPEEKPIK